MKGLTLTGGLGDAFITLHEFTGYEALETLVPGERASIYIISHNPFVPELFRWHPKVSQIDVFQSRYFFTEYNDAWKRSDSGLPSTPIDLNQARPRTPVRFWPSPEDVAVIDRELPKGPFLAAALTASGMEIENRNIPPEIASSAFSLARRRGIKVVLLGRTYQGPHAPKHTVRPAVDGLIDLTDRLSVPGTAEVVKRARAVLSAHSCLLLLSWFERKPVFATYPPKYSWHDFEHPSPFGFGKDYPETVRMLFSQYQPERFDMFLRKNFPEVS